jgi:thiol-disulfide isomerase/thioredoxin
VSARRGLRGPWFPSLGEAITAIAVLVAVGIGVGATALLSHGHRPAVSASRRDHGQAIAGPKAGLLRRVRGLRGQPIVITVWASWCQPCRADLGVATVASRRFRGRVAFLGADAFDTRRAAATFLREHPVGFSSYRSTRDLRPILSRPVAAVPITIFISPAGRVVFVHDGAYSSVAVLSHDITTHTQ